MDNLDNNGPTSARDVTSAANVAAVNAVAATQDATSLSPPRADNENMAIGVTDQAEPVVRRAARGYIAKGLQLVRLAPGIKRPVSDAWQNAKPRAEDFRPDENIGVQLGAKSGYLVDLDFDIPEARALSGLPCFFGHLLSFRRTSAPADAPGHRVVICVDAPDQVEKFDFRGAKEQAAIAPLNLSKSVVLEIRAGKGQTAFPPSSLEGDLLVFGSEPGGLTSMAWVNLRARAGLLAFSAFAAACYPPEGNRDNFCFQLAGAFVHAGIEVDTAEQIIVAIAELKGDDPRQRQGKAKAAAERHAAGEPVLGLPSFLDFVGMQACEKRVRGWLQMATSSNGPLAPGMEQDAAEASINVANPNIAERTQKIEDGLIGAGLEVFRLGDQLVYPSRLEADEVVENVRRPKNLVRLRRATADWLALQASRLLTFVRHTKDGEKRVPPTPDLMKPLEVAIEERKFPSVTGLVATPTLARNEPGYDAASKLYLSFEAGAFGDIPFEPSKEEARAALDEIFAPARYFPFDTEADKSVWLAAMLTVVVRGLLSRCPAFIFDAPSAGSGKTYLCEMVGVLGLGVKPPAASWGESEEENSKVLFSMLREGDPVMLFDNVMTEIGSADLCKALTSSDIKGRILGVSENAILGTRTLLMFNGNNVRIAGDMTRRAVRCRIDAKLEKPDERSFDFHPVAYVENNRPALVRAAIVVLRAYVSAGKPAKLTTFNSFGDVLSSRLTGARRYQRIAVLPHPKASDGLSSTLFDGTGLAMSLAFKEAYAAAEAFSRVYAARQPGAGFLKTILLRRIGSSAKAGLDTARHLLGRLEGELVPEQERGDEKSPETEKPVLEGEELQLLRDVERNLASVVDGADIDPKVKVVLHYLQQHGWLEKNGAIIFSQYFTTAEWVAEALCAEFPSEPVAVYAGGAASFIQQGTERRAAGREHIKAAIQSGDIRLPAFALSELRASLQAIWNEAAQRDAGLTFLPGQVVVSVRGGQVVAGGAPLDLIVEKVQMVQSLFYRTAEYLKSVPLRKKGPPSKDLQELCRPWIFQSVPGSYQFSVSVQKPAQGELFPGADLDPRALTRKFLAILKATNESPDAGLRQEVDNEDYRVTFLKLTRNLAPTGRVFGEMIVRDTGDRSRVVLTPASRQLIADTLKGPSTPAGAQIDQPNSIVLKGILRALDLDHDWLDVSVGAETKRVKGVGEAIDDLIGPMVNHEVKVTVKQGRGQTLKFIDIELED